MNRILKSSEMGTERRAEVVLERFGVALVEFIVVKKIIVPCTVGW